MNNKKISVIRYDIENMNNEKMWMIKDEKKENMNGKKMIINMIIQNVYCYI